MSKYQLVLRCRSCRHRYKRVLDVGPEEDIDSVPNPPCPKCSKKPRLVDVYETSSAPIAHDGIAGIVRAQQGPGIVGANVSVKAIDKTAQIVMEDHRLTDLKTNVRVGDTVAPSLPPVLQKQADNFFGAGNIMKGPARTMQQRRLQAAVRSALAGHNRATSVDVKSILPDNRVAMRRVGVQEVSR